VTHTDPRLDQLVDKVRDLDPGSRALLDLSVRRGLGDPEIASVLGTDPSYVTATRTRVINDIAADLRLDDGDLAQLESALAELPADAWLPKVASSDAAPAGANGASHAGVAAPEAAPEPEAPTEPAPEAAPEPESEAAPEPDTAPEPEPEPEAEAAAEPEPEPEPEAAAEPEPPEPEPAEPAPAETEPGVAEPAEAEPSRGDIAARAGAAQLAAEEATVERAVPEKDRGGDGGGAAPIPVVPSPRRFRRGFLLICAAVAVVLLGAGSVVALNATDGDTGDGGSVEPAAPPAQPQPQEPLEPGAPRLAPLPGTEGATGTARLEGQTLELTVTGLPRSRGSYEVWLYDSIIEARPLGRLGPAGRDRLAGRFEARGLSRYRFVDVSFEPRDGNRNHSGRSVLRIPTNELR
jgi:hypothetical protein